MEFKKAIMLLLVYFTTFGKSHASSSPVSSVCTKVSQQTDRQSDFWFLKKKAFLADLMLTDENVKSHHAYPTTPTPWNRFNFHY